MRTSQMLCLVISLVHVAGLGCDGGQRVAADGDDAGGAADVGTTLAPDAAVVDAGEQPAPSCQPLGGPGTREVAPFESWQGAISPGLAAAALVERDSQQLVSVDLSTGERTIVERRSEAGKLAELGRFWWIDDQRLLLTKWSLGNLESDDVVLHDVGGTRKVLAEGACRVELSPDRAWLLVLRDCARDGNYELRGRLDLWDLHATSVKTLVDQPLADAKHVFSADSKRVAFAQRVTPVGLKDQLWRLDLGGSKVAEPQLVAPAIYHIYGFAPGGALLFHDAAPGDPKKARLMVLRPEHSQPEVVTDDLWLLDVFVERDRGFPRNDAQLEHDASLGLATSRDGKWLLATRATSKSAWPLALVSLETGETRALAEDFAYHGPGSARLDHDGRNVVYLASLNNELTLKRVATSGGGAEAIGFPVAGVDGFDLSPASGELALVEQPEASEDEAASVELWVTKTAGGAKRVLRAEQAGHDKRFDLTVRFVEGGGLFAWSRGAVDWLRYDAAGGKTRIDQPGQRPLDGQAFAGDCVALHGDAKATSLTCAPCQ